jgi:UDP-glucose 4-epimerase
VSGTEPQLFWPARQVFVTGAAGFIGSMLSEALLSAGAHVVGWDNFSTGRRQFVETALTNPRYILLEGDNLDRTALTSAMRGCDFVCHLAANADVRFGLEHPSKDFEQNTLATFNVLEAMRANDIRGMAFSSTGSIYGEATVFPTPETYQLPIQTSLYGASKLAGEAMIQAYCEGFGLKACIFRFVSILGPRYTHGHVFDFYRQLQMHPDHLCVLGDGSQRKSYLYIEDCVRAMLHSIQGGFAETSPHGVAIFNLGTDEYCAVRDSIKWICERLCVYPKVIYSGGNKGWTGDNPLIYLDTSRIRQTGWRPSLTIQDAIENTVDWLHSNRWVFEDNHNLVQGTAVSGQALSRI